jgi:nicotinic acid phosphoribosyltransferase
MGICKELSVKDQCTWKEEQLGLLTTVFKDGKLVKETTLDEIRNRLNGK